MAFFPSSDKIEFSQRPPKLPPNKPTSQMAATMPADPDEDKIDMFQAFVGACDRTTAIRYLKAKHNDVEAAVNALLDGEDISKSEAASTWDESAWTADREGNHSEKYLHPLGASASTAATRPNSPAPSMTHRQNMQPSSKTQEDEDLFKALEMSQADMRAPTSGGQEMGTIAADGKETRFGPATRQEYDERSWGVVPFNLTDKTDEVIPDLDASDRVNQPGQPRLLKHLPDGDYLPSFLTICHSIDGVREALLMREHLQFSYGEDGEWWRGHPIALPTIVHVSDGSAAEPDRDQDDDLIAEVQRLMAFLGSSDRSYASVAPLTQTRAIRDSSPLATRSKTLLELFIQSWVAAASAKVGRQGSLNNLFTTTVGTNALDGMDTPDMNLVDLPVRLPEGEKSDLMERLDDLLWDADSDGEVTSDNFIERPAEMVVVRMYQQDASKKQLRIEVPAEFYIDKYLPQNLETTRGTRREMAMGKKRIAMIEEIEGRLKNWKHPRKSSQLDAKRLLTHTLGHFSGQNRAQVLATEKSLAASAEVEDDHQDPLHYRDITRSLQNIIASIDDKLTILADEKEKTRKAIAELSRSPLSGLQEGQLQHRYTLRGVATKPNITYVLAPIDPSTGGEAESPDDDTPPGMQWWRLEYEVPLTGTTAKITKTVAADYDVLRAVELEHRSALLVYASDGIQAPVAAEAAPPQSQPISQIAALPAPLRTFITKDNALFRHELSSDPAQPPAYDDSDAANSAIAIVRPSIEPDGKERSHDSSGIRGRGRAVSLDSTHAEDGASPSPSSPSPPAYDDDRDVEMFGQQQQQYPVGYGLGCDLKASSRPGGGGGWNDGGAEDEVHEIRLEDDDKEMGSGSSDGEQARRESRGDEVMADATTAAAAAATTGSVTGQGLAVGGALPKEDPSASS